MANTDSMTPKQRRLRKDIEEIASIVELDHWNILNYKPSHRTGILQRTKDGLIRGHVVFVYTMVDQLLTTAICRYYFPNRPPFVGKTIPQLWRVKQFKDVQSLFDGRNVFDEKTKSR